MFSAGAAFFTSFDSLNPLDWRSFNQSDWLMVQFHTLIVRLAAEGFPFFGKSADYSNHHFLNLCLEAGIAFLIAFYFAKHLHQKVVNQGWVATYSAVQVWCVHEGMWWITYYFFWKPPNCPTCYPTIGHLSGLGEIITIGMVIFTAVLGLYWPKKYIVAMLGFYALWIAAGFPITESYLGNTQWYGTLWGDSWEVASWGFAVAAYWFLERQGLLNWYRKVRKISQSAQL